MTRAQFAATVLKRAGIPVSNGAMQAMLGWMAAEGGHWNNTARHNPLNTTRIINRGETIMNGAKVKSYRSWEDGIRATVETMKLPAYRGIVAALKAGKPMQTANAIESSPWGTGGLAKSTIPRAPKKLGTTQPLASGAGPQRGRTGTSKPTPAATPAANTEQLNKLAVLQNYLQTTDPRSPLLQLVGSRLEVAAQEPAPTPQAKTTTPGTRPSRRSGSTATPTGSGSWKAQGLSPIKELFYDPQGGWKGTRSIGPIGNHSDHVHVAAGPKTIVRLGKRAQQMGLHVGENPKFGGVAPVHVTNSNHYHARAIDVSGSPKKMSAFAHYIRRLYGL